MIERGRSQPTEETMEKLQQALERAGVEFSYAGAGEPSTGIKTFDGDIVNLLF